jgi:hypothetical protein
MWINHVSNYCPVDADTLVDVQFRKQINGKPLQLNRVMAWAYRWDCQGNGGDILKYRICEG